MTNEGTIDVTTAGSVVAPNGFVSSGDVILDAGTSLTVTTGPLDLLAGGSLSGSASITGSVQSAGTVAPSDTLSISGGYTQLAGGTLAVEIGGTSPGQYGGLDVSGAVVLAGSLEAAFVGFTPAALDAFTLVVGSPVSGTFGTVVVTGLAGSHSVTYSGTEVDLIVQ